MQAEVNIGLFGHVDHGKTTLTKAMSGKWTDTHSEEIKRGISIRLGYADANVYKCKKCGNNSFQEMCEKCNEKGEFQRRISFIDAPGHETLMTTAISASSIIDGALFLISASEPCPQPQTLEHLMVLQTLGIKNLIVIQTKIDLVSKEKAVENYNQIKKLLSQFYPDYEKIPIVPVCAFRNINIDKVADSIQEYIPTPKRDENAPLRVYITRSFDINKPGTKINELKGGVIGGSIVQGTLKNGEKIIVVPGISKGGKNNPAEIEVKGIMAENEKLEKAHAGGLVAIGTDFDPSLTKSDGLAGSIIGKKDDIPEVRSELSVRYKVFDRADMEKVYIKEGDPIVINVHTATTVGIVLKVKKGVMNIRLKKIVAADKGSKLALSARVGQRWRLIAWGEII